MPLFYQVGQIPTYGLFLSDPRMKAGDKMSFTLMPDGVVIMQMKNRQVSDLAGLLYKKDRKPVPIELLSR